MIIDHVTHAHADHYFGLNGSSNDSGARAVAVPIVAEEIAANNETNRANWAEMFTGKALDNTAIPESLDGDDITVDGDVVYNGINPFLAASDPEGWRGWLGSIAKVAAPGPRIVVAGHKRPELPDDIAASLGAPAAYIRDFLTEVEVASGARDLVERMQRPYPEHGNPSALILSAVTALKRIPPGGN